MSGTLPLQELNGEHQSLAADVRQIEAAVREIGAAQAPSWAEDARTLRDQVEMFRRALAMHFRREEEGLFPDAQRMVADQAGPGDALSQFFAEEGDEDTSAHASLRTRVKDVLSLAEAMTRATGPDQESLGRLRALVSTTRSLLESHADRESKIIFPMIARALNDDQMEQVARRMNQLGAAADLVDSSEADMDDLSDLGVGQD
jgi:regulator of cell morphogenesis and NO signaling